MLPFLDKKSVLLYNFKIKNYLFLNLTFDLLSSLTDLQPINVISRLISSFIFCKIASTPFCPPAPSANKYPLPKLHAFAPNDKAFRTCVPLLTPPSKITLLLVQINNLCQNYMLLLLMIRLLEHEFLF